MRSGAATLAAAAAGSLALGSSGSAPGTPTCSDETAVSLSTSWAGGSTAESDLFYVAIAATPDGQPFALQTSAQPSTTIHDLLPSTDYYLSWRAHPQAQTAAGRNIGWDWGNYTAPVKCTTKATDESAPSHPQREGDLAETSISVRWAPPTALPATAGAALEHVAGHRTGPAAPFTWVPASATAEGSGVLRAVLRDLAPGATHEVVAAVRLPGGEIRRGPSVPMRTAAPAVRYTPMVRVSEFTNDIDFLDNHDSATSAALAVLLSRMAKQVNVSASCLDKLGSLCPAQRGQGKSCLACVGDLSSLPDECGDKTMSNYNSHFFCGEGWPSFSMFSTPMAEYCVENTPAPLEQSPTQDKGWAEYLSCDAPEAGESNHPTTPKCICWVPWDRAAVSHQPKHVYDKYCRKNPQGGGDLCSCGDAVNSSSIFVKEGSTSARYIGKSPVWLPYTFYTKPQDDYPNSTDVGDNFSTPKNGSCAETAKLGDDDCTWKRQPTVRIIYFEQLLAAGWQSSMPTDTAGNVTGSLHQIASMKAAWESLAKHMSPRCCGC